VCPFLCNLIIVPFLVSGYIRKDLVKTYRLQYIRCGKGCRGCPHGPYWYAFWKEDGKTRSEYIGKRRREDSEGKPPVENIPIKSHPWEGILNRRTASLGLACTILEVTEASAQEVVERAFRRLSRIHHPDRGGEERVMVMVEAAYSFVMKWNNWK